MSPLLLLPLTPRFIALTLAILSTVGFAIALAFDQQSILLAICFSVALFLTIVGTIDLFQTSHSVLRNYPILAHFRFIFEGNTSSRATRTACRSAATGARWPISAPRWRSMCDRSAPTTTRPCTSWLK